MRSVLHTGTNNTPIQSKQLGWREVILKEPQNTQPLRSLFRKRSNVIFPRKITRKGFAKNIKNKLRFELCVFEEDIVVVVIDCVEYRDGGMEFFRHRKRPC